jgi:hypothetical protein
MSSPAERLAGLHFQSDMLRMQMEDVDLAGWTRLCFERVPV